MDIAGLNSELVTCRRCPRLVEWRERVAMVKRRSYREWDYWGRPVPGFGDTHGRILVVGLAPGAHGSNRTGRMFTGDASGDFLYPALYRAGFASQPGSHSSNDGLTLTDLYITAVCRCAPPGNKPTPEEMQNCRSYLKQEIEIIRPKVFVALGRIAFENLLLIFGRKKDADTPDPFPSASDFAHAALFSINTPFSDHKCWLLASYHPSRQNTQTGRLTVGMFDRIWSTVRDLLER